jgi:CheY-like chemotaxis protein
MVLKVLVLSSQELAPWYQRLRSALCKTEIELMCMTELPEFIHLLQIEKYHMALIDGAVPEMEKTCFQTLWLSRVPAAVLAGEAKYNMNLLQDIGITNIIPRISGIEKIIDLIKSTINKGRLFAPKTKILIIENDRYIRDAIGIYFQIYWPESEVVKASSGREGISMLNQAHPEMILLDLELPGMSGFEFLNHIRAYIQIPVVILTANRDPEFVIKAVQAGASGYMLKPFKQMELIPRVRKVADQLMTVKK